MRIVGKESVGVFEFGVGSERRRRGEEREENERREKEKRRGSGHVIPYLLKNDIQIIYKKKQTIC